MQPVPCEVDVCWITKRQRTDPVAIMELDPIGEFVAQSYEEIIALSRKGKITVKRGGKYTDLLIPTIDGLEMWMKFCDWESAPVNQGDFFNLILVYHLAIKAHTI